MLVLNTICKAYMKKEVLYQNVEEQQVFFPRDWLARKHAGDITSCIGRVMLLLNR
jgi:hypothetical protein